ncbi:MAG: dihydrofolate reductase family protein [Rhizomicrobium sp.]
MRKIVASAFVSLDGVMQAPGGPEEDPTGGFEEGGWSFSYWDEMMHREMGAAMAARFDLLLGRKTYEVFAAHWPYAGDDPVSQLFNRITKYVASRTLNSLSWVNSRLIEGDVAGEVGRLKQTSGPDLQVHGSSVLLQTLIGADLIDEYRVWIFPLVLGHGKRLFEPGVGARALSLAATRLSSTGVLVNTYRPAGPLKPGSFAQGTPSPAEIARREKLQREA